MHTTRLITSDELGFVRDLFSIDNTLIGEPIDPEFFETMLVNWKNLLDKDLMKITVLFNEANEAIAMYTATLYPNIRGWWVGATKIKEPNNHFNTSAKIMLPALELMLTELESKGYYKFWMGAPEKHHNIRNSVMTKYSEKLCRYDWYDEYIIPQGERCDIPIWEQNRRTCNWSDVLVRMFVLRQEFRKPLIAKERLTKSNV